MGKKHSFPVFPFFFFTFMLTLFFGFCIAKGITPSRMIGAAFCHQIESRSPAGFSFCYRCSGMFSGIFTGIFLWITCSGYEQFFSKKVFLLFFVSLFIFLLDIANSTIYLNIDLYQETPDFRFISAFPFGFFLSQVIMPIFSHFLPEVRIQQRQSKWIKVLFTVIFLVLSYLMIFSESGGLLIIAGIMVCCGSFGFLWILYMILIKCISILTKQDWRLLTVSLSSAALSLLQITLFGGAHIILLQAGLWVA